MEKQTVTATPRQKKFVCSRPRLAEYLIDQGFTCTAVKDNLFTPGMKAWEFDLSKELAWLVTRYYADEVGKEPPQLIRDTVAKEVAQHGQQ